MLTAIQYSRRSLGSIFRHGGLGAPLCRAGISVLPPEFYNENFPKILANKSLVTKKFDRNGKELLIVGVPMEMCEQNEIRNFWMNEVQKLPLEERPKHVVIQLDPTQFVYNNRSIMINSGMKEITDAVVKVLEEDPIAPLSWEEAFINPITVRTLWELDYRAEHKGEAPKLPNIDPAKPPTEEEKKSFQQFQQSMNMTLQKHVLSFQHHSNFFEDLFVFLSLHFWNGSQVIFGDFPEFLYRLLMGSTIPLSQLKLVFKEVCEQAAEFRKDEIASKGKFEPEADFMIRTFSMAVNPGIFIPARDIYISAFCKHIMEKTDGKRVHAYVAAPNFPGVCEYLEKYDNELNFMEMITTGKIIDPKKVEPDDMLIEKQAILDVLLGSNVWANQMIKKNPFAYLATPYTTLSEEAKKEMHKKFFMNYKKYHSVLNSVLEGKTGN